MSKYTAFADNSLKMAPIIENFFDLVENMVEQAENAGCQHSIHFPPMLSKGST